MASQARQLADKSVAPPGRRNLIINGAMQVAQRSTSAAGITTSGYDAIDRVAVAMSGLGTWTASQESDGPNGFSYSYKLLCTVADSSPAASDYCAAFRQKIEGQDLQHLKFGTSEAKDLTVSFWVKSNKTGDGTVEVRQTDNALKHATLAYTISAANTWEYKTLKFNGDASGIINNDTGAGLELLFWLNAGSDYTSGSHSASFQTYSNANLVPSNLGVGGAVNDYWQITGVQLEVGSTATEFEHRSYGEELALCQRYYQEITTNLRTQTIGAAHRQTTNVIRGQIPTPTPLRDDPSISFSGTYSVLENDGGSTSLTSVSGLYGSNGYVVYTGTATGVTGGCSTVLGYGGSIKISAEL